MFSLTQQFDIKYKFPLHADSRRPKRYRTKAWAGKLDTALNPSAE